MTRAGSEDIIGGLFRALRLHPTIRWRSLQLVSTIAAVARGEAVSIVAESALPSDKAPGYVKKPLRPAARRQVALATPDARRMSPAAREFIRMAQEVFPHPAQSTARPAKR